MNAWNDIAAQISAARGGAAFVIKNRQALGGGCINNAFLVSDGVQQFFVKTNAVSCTEMFAAEAEGLREISRAQVIKVPRPLCWGSTSSMAYLVLEYLPLSGAGTPTGTALGKQLAALHAVVRPRFGWHRDNTIGLTPQINTDGDDWIEFWRERRLRHQSDLVRANGYFQLADKLERVIESVPQLLVGHRVQAALLHGDLWGGNFAADECGQPVIFDPAVYYGDRETDLAMTELFGGFPATFQQAYCAEYPLESGYPLRKTLYNLYHILNHTNLFGGGYARQAQHMTERLLSELR